MTQDNTPDRPTAPSKRGLVARVRNLLPFGTKRRSVDKQALSLPPMTRGMQAFSLIMFFLLGSGLTAFWIINPLQIPFMPQPMQMAAMEESAPAADAAPAAAYQCPMHPEVMESKPGECPICGMDLVKVDTPAGAGGGAQAHTEESAVYQCPMHPEVMESKPDECPICGMDLVKVDQVPAASTKKTASGEREILYWYAPMDPTYVRDGPGKSPMGMDLVPKYADEDMASDEGVIRIDPVQVQNIGVVSVPARSADIARHSRTVGIVDYNTEKVAWVNTKFEGWVEKTYLNFVGQEVRIGDPLFEIYSPELVTTQEEYLRALEYRDSVAESGRREPLEQADSLLAASRQRLRYWDIDDVQVETLKRTRQIKRTLVVRSSIKGLVVKIMDGALEGMYIRPGMNLYQIADLSTVWVHADIYETDIPWIREGRQATVSFPNDPTRKYRGKVLFLYPEVSEKTRTLRVCIEVANPDGKLRPGMYADADVEGPLLKNTVVVPQSAVIRSGERNLVFLDLGEGRFASREVVLGVRGEGDDIQIRSGIAPGDLVVTQAQFMLDSEARIQEAIAKFMKRGTASAATDEAPMPAEHQH